MVRPIKKYYFIFKVAKESQPICVFLDFKEMDIILYFNWSVLASVKNLEAANRKI
jgi:hypothetical protein